MGWGGEGRQKGNGAKAGVHGRILTGQRGLGETATPNNAKQNRKTEKKTWL